jgi:hypothetical protein
LKNLPPAKANLGVAEDSDDELFEAAPDDDSECSMFNGD